MPESISGPTSWYITRTSANSQQTPRTRCGQTRMLAYLPSVSQWLLCRWQPKSGVGPATPQSTDQGISNRLYHWANKMGSQSHHTRKEHDLQRFQQQGEGPLTSHEKWRVYILHPLFFYLHYKKVLSILCC